MNWDEIDGAGPAKATTLTRPQYQWLQFKVAVGLWVVLILVHLPFAFLTPRPWLNSLPPWAFWTAAILARLGVDAWLKWHGLSLAGPMVQIWGKSGAAPTGRAVIEDHAVELQTPRAELLMFSVGCLVVCLPTFALAVGLMIQDTKHQQWLTDWPSQFGLLAAVALASSGVGALGCWLLARAVTPKRRYRADATGFQSFLDKKFLPWADIATCRVTTRHDALGDPLTVTHELVNWRGDTLLKLNLAWLPTPDRDRLIRFIHARLPKPVQDEWGTMA